MVKENAALCPLVKTGAAIGAGDNAHLHIVIPGIQVGKTFRKVDSRSHSVRINRHIHRTPKTISKNEKPFVSYRQHIIRVATPRHIGLSNQQNGMLH